MEISHKFATSPVAQGKLSVTNATVMVAISNPVVATYLIQHVLSRRSLMLLVMFFYKFDFQSCPASQQRKTTTNSSAGEFLSFCELIICLKNCFCFCLLTSLYFNYIIERETITTVALIRSDLVVILSLLLTRGIGSLRPSQC